MRRKYFGIGLYLLFLLSPAVLAFNLDGKRWANGETVFFVDFSGEAPSGQSWNTAFVEAMESWSEATDFNFTLNNTYRDPCEGFSTSDSGVGFPAGDGDSVNGTDFASTVCGNAFGSGVLAITLTLSEAGNLGFSHIRQSDIIFNSSIDWDIYSGPKRTQVDFGRTALHELGHAIGLDHENDEPAIMFPKITALSTLQVDDIAGVNSIYGPPENCLITALALNGVLNDELNQENDCAIQELMGGGNDSSLVDVYSLSLSEETKLNILMESSALDSVLLLMSENLVPIQLDDDSGLGCNAKITGTFPAGEYLLLANTFVFPDKCPGNTGNYKISISTAPEPILGAAVSLSGSSVSSIFSGGASKDNGLTYSSVFSQTDNIDVTALIQPAQEHLGEAADFFALAQLPNGNFYALHPSGQFKKMTSLANIPAFTTSDELVASESLSIVRGLSGKNLEISNVTIRVFVGYSLQSAPAEIYYNSEPIRFSIE